VGGEENTSLIAQRRDNRKYGCQQQEQQEQEQQQQQ
jgi:hypothetical protein